MSLEMLDDVRPGIAGLLLRDRDRDPLAPFGAPSTKNSSAAARLLACAKPVGPLATLVMWLVGTLHGSAPPFGEGDRYSRARMKSSRRVSLCATPASTEGPDFTSDRFQLAS